MPAQGERHVDYERLAEGIGKHGPARRRARGYRLLLWGVCVLEHDSPELRDSLVGAYALDLALERVGLHALLNQPLHRRGTCRNGARDRGFAGGERAKDFHAAHVCVLAIQVVAQHTHLEHKHVNRRERRRIAGVFGRVGVVLVEKEVVPALGLGEFTGKSADVPVAHIDQIVRVRAGLHEQLHRRVRVVPCTVEVDRDVRYRRPRRKMHMDRVRLAAVAPV